MPTNEDFQAQLRELSLEVRSLRDEVERLKGGEAAACRAFDRLRVISRAASLGGVESLCSLPILTSHWGYSDEALAKAGVTKGMMRVSLGLEDPEDLIADLKQALD